MKKSHIVMLLTFLLQGLATGLMLAAAQYIATWVLGTGVTLLFLSLIAPAIARKPASSAEYQARLK